MAIAHDDDATLTAAAAAVGAPAGRQAVRPVGRRPVVAAHNDGLRVGGVFGAGGLCVPVTARVVAVELAQGLGAVLGGAVVDRDGAALGDGRHQAGRGRGVVVGLEREPSKGERQGAVRRGDVTVGGGACVWTVGRAVARAVLWRLLMVVVVTKAGLRLGRRRRHEERRALFMPEGSKEVVAAARGSEDQPVVAIRQKTVDGVCICLSGEVRFSGD